MIKKNNKYTKKGKVGLYKTTSKDEKNIFPTAFHHTFPINPGAENEENVTVAQYYTKKGIDLKFPYMPIVRISNQEWFPIEFLWQGKNNEKSL
jgi:hypothetical protein